MSLRSDEGAPAELRYDESAQPPAARPIERGTHMFESIVLPAEPSAIAPDGSEVRVLLGVAGGGLAHFELAPKRTSVAVVHRTVEEIWYFLAGLGQMWRRSPQGEEAVIDVYPGVCLTIQVGTEFQFRSLSHEGLAAVGATLPPWPGDGETRFVEGRWEASVEPGPA